MTKNNIVYWVKLLILSSLIYNWCLKSTDVSTVEPPNKSESRLILSELYHKLVPHTMQNYSPTTCNPTSYVFSLLNTKPFYGYYRYNGQRKTSYFLIHGLWAETCKDCQTCGYPSFCNTDERFDLDTLKPLWKQLQKNWYPGVNPCQNTLIQHEWYKHGTCTSMSEFSYFNKSLELFEYLKTSGYIDQCNPRNTECRFLMSSNFTVLNATRSKPNLVPVLGLHYIVFCVIPGLIKKTLTYCMNADMGTIYPRITWILGGMSILGLAIYLVYKNSEEDLEEDLDQNINNILHDLDKDLDGDNEVHVKISYEYTDDLSLEEKREKNLALLEKLRANGLMCESLMGSWILAKGEKEEVQRIIAQVTNSNDSDSSEEPDKNHQVRIIPARIKENYTGSE